MFFSISVTFLLLVTNKGILSVKANYGHIFFLNYGHIFFLITDACSMIQKFAQFPFNKHLELKRVITLELSFVSFSNSCENISKIDRV